MRKKILDEFPTKSKKRELKRRLKMKIHGRSLLLPSKHAGKKLSSGKL
jgi:hypothetical protein